MLLLGSSWGGYLAALFALNHPERVSGLVLASPLLSTKLWLQDARFCREEMGAAWNERVNALETLGQTHSTEYEELKRQYEARFVCRLGVEPECVTHAKRGMGVEVYRTMWGTAEFHCDGNLRGADLTDRLHELRVPVLFTGGRYDEARPETLRFFASRIPGAQVEIFQHSSHSAHLEQPEEYFAALGRFLAGIEGH
jgi:proline iminopeptidase